MAVSTRHHGSRIDLLAGLAALVLFEAVVLSVFAYRSLYDLRMDALVHEVGRLATEMDHEAERLGLAPGRPETFEALAEYWRGSQKEIPGTYLRVIDLDGRIVFHSARPDWVGRTVSESILSEVRAPAPPSNERRPARVDRQYKSWFAQSQICAFVPFPRAGLVVSVHVASASVEALARGGVRERTLRIAGVASLPIVLLALGIGYQRARRATRVARGALRDAEAVFGELLNQASEGIYLLDGEGVVRAANPRACHDLGFRSGELAGRTLRQIAADVSEADLARFREVIEGAIRPYTTERRFRHKDGSLIEVEIRGGRVEVEGKPHLLVLAREISERKRAEAERARLREELARARRLEAVGRLAGGAAHDFNNLLLVITGLTDLVLDRVPAQAEFRRDLEEIRRAADRAMDVTRQLMGIARKRSVELMPVALNGLLGHLAPALERLLGERIALRREFAEGLPPVLADPGQLEQAIVSLVMNARDALPEGGEVRLATTLEGPPASPAPPGTPRWVLLRVTDTGVGMDEEVRSQVFEPFFTTKASGTGLGLALAYVAVTEAGGEIRVESALGQGTTFELRLPVFEAGERQEALGFARAEDAPRAQTGETVLLLEDEGHSLARYSLEAQGYRVLEARSAKDLLAYATTHAGPVHLLIIDAAVPGESGPEFRRAMRAARPEARLLLLASRHRVTSASQRAPTLEKPFSPSALARKVREVLDAPRGEGDDLPSG